MDLKQLRYFVSVVEEGTISAAAKKLFISQPPLSAQMKMLENELGCVLFERGQRQIQLTDAGKQLYSKATVLLEISRVTKEEMREYADTQSAMIRIGIVSSVVSPIATDWIADFTGQHPEINFAVYESNTYDLIEMLRRGIVHIAAIRTPYVAADLIAKPLKSESIVAIGKTSLFQDSAQTITLKALSALSIILYRRWEAVIKSEFDKAELPLRLKCLCDNARTVVDLAAHGVGVGLVPASAIEMIGDSDVVYKELEECRIESRIDLIYRENVYLPPCAVKFMEYLNHRLPFSG